MAAVVLYNDINFGGDALGADSEIFNLSATNYNDKASLIVINKGTWTFCTDANLQGTCKVLGPGSYARVEDVGIPNDAIWHCTEMAVKTCKMPSKSLIFRCK